MLYDPESNILSIELRKKTRISHASLLGNFIIHFSKTNTPVLIEILNADKLVKQKIKLNNELCQALN